MKYVIISGLALIGSGCTLLDGTRHACPSYGHPVYSSRGGGFCEAWTFDNHGQLGSCGLSSGHRNRHRVGSLVSAFLDQSLGRPSSNNNTTLTHRSGTTGGGLASSQRGGQKSSGIHRGHKGSSHGGSSSKGRRSGGRR